MPIRFDQPQWLWLLLLAVPIVLLGRRSLATLERSRRWTAVGLRLVVLTILVLMLADLQAVRWHSDLTVMAVVDQSQSIRRFAKPPVPVDPDAPTTTTNTDTEPDTSIDDWITGWLNRAVANHQQDDRLGVVAYDGQPNVRALPSTTFDTDAGTVVQPIDGTDTAAALRLAMALFSADSSKRIVLVSDGNDTAAGADEDVLAAAREARSAGIPIDVLPIEYRVDSEVMVEGLYAPREASEGQTVALRAVLRATGPTDGLLYIQHDDEPIDLNGPAPGMGFPIRANQWTIEELTDQQDAEDPDAADVQATPALGTGRHVWVRKFDLPLAHSGTNRFEAFFEPGADDRSGDTMSVNNRAQAFTLAYGKGRLLYVDHLAAQSSKVLPEALRDHGIDLDVLPGTAIPTRMDQLQRYDAVVLHNVPSEMVSPAQQKLLVRYVNDMGGGLVMIGGPDGFGAGGWTHTPIDHILPVECQIPSQTVLPSGALVIVLDRSGSMSSGVTGSVYSKQEIANEAAILALSTLYPQDLVGVIAFDNSPKWVVQLQVNSDPHAVAKKVRKIHAGGGTNIYPALVEAYQALAKLNTQDAAVKHVILLTDGQSQSGQYYQVVGNMARSGITLSTIGVGDSVNASLLAQLAQMSGGTYHPIADPNNLPRVFIKEARTIRKNLIKELSFTPQFVRTGSPIATGIGAMPPLQGFVLTGPKRDPRVYTPIVGPEGEPIFAHWNVGLGRTAAFTSDATNRWATQWLPWNGYVDFWARTARAIARPTASREYDLLTTITKDTLHIRLDAGSDATPSGGKRLVQNFLQVAGSVLNPNGSATPVKLKQTGPGLYEAQVTAAEPGNYIVSLFVQGDAASAGPQAGAPPRSYVFGGTSRLAGAELRRFRSNRARLEQVAAITGGRVLQAGTHTTPSVFERQGIVASRSIRPMWRQLMYGLLVFFLLDVASRRIAWDVGATGQWFKERAEAMGRVLKPREVEAATTLAALKTRAAQVDKTLGASPSTQADPPKSDRKFEADTDTVTDEDFATAVGAATQNDDSPRPAPQDSPLPKETENEPETTQRLLNAKRRATRRMEPEDQ